MRVLRLGLAGPMKVRRPAPDEPRIETPQWALDRAGELSREMVANIEASGVQVVGDLSRLVEVPVSGLTGDRLPDPAIPPSIAASMAMGICWPARERRRRAHRARPCPEPAGWPPSSAAGYGAPSGRTPRIAWRRLRSSSTGAHDDRRDAQDPGPIPSRWGARVLHVGPSEDRDDLGPGGDVGRSRVDASGRVSATPAACATRRKRPGPRPASARRYRIRARRPRSVAGRDCRRDPSRAGGQGRVQQRAARPRPPRRDPAHCG